VQTPVRVPAGVTLAPGDPLLFRHAKAGELCERFNELLLIEDGAVVDAVATYRGDGKCFF
jgi:D-serine deaminase-like pyridoxal phosphate-dependent protein